MQKLLTYTLLICVFTLPLRAQTTETADAPGQTAIKVDIVALQREVAVQSKEIENLITAVHIMNANQEKAIDRMNANQEKAIDRQNSLLVAFIAIPLGIIALITTWRSIRERTMEKQIEALTRVIEAQNGKNQENNQPTKNPSENPL